MGYHALPSTLEKNVYQHFLKKKKLTVTSGNPLQIAQMQENLRDNIS